MDEDGEALCNEDQLSCGRRSSEGASSSNDEEPVPDSQSTVEDSASSQLRFIGKDQTVWNVVKVNHNQPVGRTPSENVFTVIPGVKASARKKVDNPLSAWRLLITENILKICKNLMLSLE
jgi:hypothetical protein